MKEESKDPLNPPKYRIWEGEENFYHLSAVQWGEGNSEWRKGDELIKGGDIKVLWEERKD